MMCSVKLCMLCVCVCVCMGVCVRVCVCVTYDAMTEVCYVGWSSQLWPSKPKPSILVR